MRNEEPISAIIDRDCWIRSDLFGFFSEPHLSPITHEPDGQRLIGWKPKQFTDATWNQRAHHLPYIAAIGHHARRGRIGLVSTFGGQDERILGDFGPPSNAFLLRGLRPKPADIDLPLSLLAGGQIDAARSREFSAAAFALLTSAPTDTVLTRFQQAGINTNDLHREILDMFKSLSEKTQCVHLHDLWQLIVASVNRVNFVITLDKKFSNYIRSSLAVKFETQVVLPATFCENNGLEPIALPKFYDRRYSIHEDPIKSIA
ncbi:MAG: hypothetical protein Q8S29_13400 [Phreatobacter sp.]|nr:hypothetical protein [Phreatobacter sp.]